MSKEPKVRVQVTICSTGKDAAIKLKEVVQYIINNATKDNITVIPVGLNNLR